MSAEGELDALAERAGLVPLTDYELNPYTPSLWRTRCRAARGPLSPELEGTIALPLVGSADGGGVARPVVVVHLASTIARLPQLLCRDASWRLTREYELTASGYERLDHETIFESVSVERRFAVEHPASTDPVFLRRVFSPTFLDWLGETAPPSLYFELVNGWLAVILGEGDDLEALWASAGRVATRLLGESSEGRRERAPFAEPLPAPAPADPATARGVAAIHWQRPPESVAEAAAAYRGEVGLRLGIVARALLLAGAISGLLVLLALVDWVVLGDVLSTIGLLAGAVAVFFVIFPLAIRGPRARLAAEWGKLAFAESFAETEGLTLEDPGSVHALWPELPLPGPVRRLWRGRTDSGRTYRLMLIHDPGHAAGSSGFEGLLVEEDGALPAPIAGAEQLRGAGLLAVVRPTPLPSPTAGGLRELRASIEAAG